MRIPSGYMPMYDPYRTNRDNHLLHDKIVILREEWEGPQIVSPRNLSPAMNAIGLWWKPIREKVRK